jgi:hypothetical protein
VTAVFFPVVLAEKLNKRTLQVPPPALLPNFEQPLAYVFVGEIFYFVSCNITVFVK